MEKRFPTGMYLNPPREGAPEFVRGSISIKKAEVLEWLNQEQSNDKGYVNLDVLKSREGKLYLAINDYVKPTDIKQGDPRRSIIKSKQCEACVEWENGTITCINPSCINN